MKLILSRRVLVRILDDTPDALVTEHDGGLWVQAGSDFIARIGDNCDAARLLDEVCEADISGDHQRLSSLPIRYGPGCGQWSSAKSSIVYGPAG